jgi:hypothetical protein
MVVTSKSRDTPIHRVLTIPLVMQVQLVLFGLDRPQSFRDLGLLTVANL